MGLRGINAKPKAQIRANPNSRGEYAAKAIRKNPTKNDREIAEATGVSLVTVWRTRKKTKSGHHRDKNNLTYSITSHPWEKKGLSRAERVIAFIETLPVTAGPLAGT